MKQEEAHKNEIENDEAPTIHSRWADIYSNIESLTEAVNRLQEDVERITCKEPPANNRLEALRNLLRDDNELAWVWHCNVACAFQDESDVTHREANEAAATFMRRAFGIDTRENDRWPYKDRDGWVRCGPADNPTQFQAADSDWRPIEEYDVNKRYIGVAFRKPFVDHETAEVSHNESCGSSFDPKNAREPMVVWISMTPDGEPTMIFSTKEQAEQIKGNSQDERIRQFREV